MEYLQQLENEIADKYNPDQLDTFVNRILHQRLDVFVAKAPTGIMVSNLLHILRNEGKERKFLFGLKDLTNSARLKNLISSYYDLETDEDPYDTLFPSALPLVDRVDFKAKIKSLFQDKIGGSFRYQALIANGPRYSGRTYAGSFVEFIAIYENHSYSAIDLAEASLSEIIMDLKGGLGLHSEVFPDSEAQNSRLVRGFISTLSGILIKKNGLNNGPGHCLIFDNYDRQDCHPDVKHLVDELLKLSTRQPACNLRIIILGHDNYRILAPLSKWLIAELQLISIADVQKFVYDHGKKKNLSDEIIATVNEYLLESFGNGPYSSEDLRKIGDELLSFAETN